MISDCLLCPSPRRCRDLSYNNIFQFPKKLFKTNKKLHTVIVTGNNLKCIPADDSGVHFHSTDNTPRCSHGHSLSGGAIAAIVLGIVLGLVLIGGGVYFILKRRRESEGGEFQPIGTTSA